MRRIVNAFYFSLDGLKRAFRTEAAVRQEIILLLVALPVAFLISSSAIQFAALIGSLLMILAVELLNTSIEKLSDHVRPERHEDIKYVKDLGSAAVLAACAMALLVWCATVLQLFWA
jgi:diacylglycerol kinase (ATP)